MTVKINDKVILNILVTIQLILYKFGLVIFFKVSLIALCFVIFFKVSLIALC